MNAHASLMLKSFIILTIMSYFWSLSCVILATKENTSDEGIINITMGKPGINDILNPMF